jgi:hypothetical protein
MAGGEPPYLALGDSASRGFMFEIANRIAVWNLENL